MSRILAIGDDCSVGLSLLCDRTLYRAPESFECGLRVVLIRPGRGVVERGRANVFGMLRLP